MRKKSLTLLTAFLILCCAQSVLASTILLDDWGFYIDGTTYEFYEGDTLSDILDTDSTLDADDLAILIWETSAAGVHSFIAWFDYDIDETSNTFFNEYGAVTVTGTPDSRQSWEIDEPGWVFGDIYDHLLAGSLDNANAVPAGLKEDVSFALGWDFTLLAGETAEIQLFLGTETPSSGLYLSQTDPDSDETIYFSSSLSISGTPGEVPIPEPSTLILFVFGLLGSAGLCRRKG